MKLGRSSINKMKILLIELMIAEIFNCHLISTIKKNLLLYRKILIYQFLVPKHFKKFLNFFYLMNRVKIFTKKTISMLEDLKMGFLQKYLLFKKVFWRKLILKLMRL
jgi:hypothetical protein